MTDPRIAKFLGCHRSIAEPDMAEAITQAIKEDGGVAIDPTPVGRSNWSASAYYEFCLYGVVGFGADMAEAAREWFKAARRLTRKAA